MPHTYIVNQLEQNKRVFETLLAATPAEEQHWKAAPDKWSLLEIVCHLYDEEREDFRARVRHTLTMPEEEMPPIDPAGWVTSRNYAAQDFETMLSKFLEERALSVSWLRALQNPNWESTYQHPKFGPMSAKFFLSNWLAHDFLHIRQIVKLRYDQLGQRSGESLVYAGNW